jgi:hypothetical protein
MNKECRLTAGPTLHHSSLAIPCSIFKSRDLTRRRTKIATESTPLHHSHIFIRRLPESYDKALYRGNYDTGHVVAGKNGVFGFIGNLFFTGPFFH